MRLFKIISKDKTMGENVGIVREIDSVGRLLIPKEIRERLKLDDKVELVVTVEGLLVRNPEYKLAKIED